LRKEGVIIAKRRMQDVRREMTRRAYSVRVRRRFCIGVIVGDEEEAESWRDNGRREMIVLVVCKRVSVMFLINASPSPSFHFDEG